MAEFAKYDPRGAGAEARPASMNLDVRPAERDDIARLAPIAAEREGTSGQEAAASLARFFDETAGGSALLLVAETAGSAIGFAKAAYFTPPPGSPANTAPEGWYLGGVVVSPAARRRGVGAALTAERLEWLAARDVPRVYYFANARNETSIDLHAAFGFAEVTRNFTHPHARFEGGVGVLFARDLPASRPLLRRVDHLVYATPDVEATVADVSHRLGATPSFGGSHPGRGTRNYLLASGTRSYLEIIGPDPDQPPPSPSQWSSIDSLASARMVRWAANVSDLEALAARAAARGADLGPVRIGGRRRPDGVAISWTFTDPDTVLGNGLVPFVIDWGGSSHPSSAAATGPRLVGLRAEHPDPARVRRLLDALDLPLPVTAAAAPALIATYRTRRGDVELR